MLSLLICSVRVRLVPPAPDSLTARTQPAIQMLPRASGGPVWPLLHKQAQRQTQRLLCISVLLSTSILSDSTGGCGALRNVDSLQGPPGCSSSPGSVPQAEGDFMRVPASSPLLQPLQWFSKSPVLYFGTLRLEGGKNLPWVIFPVPDLCDVLALDAKSHCSHNNRNRMPLVKEYKKLANINTEYKETDPSVSRNLIYNKGTATQQEKDGSSNRWNGKIWLLGGEGKKAKPLYYAVY